MEKLVKRGLLVSDFNVENLSAYLQNTEGLPALETSVAPYGQVVQILIDADRPCWQQSLDFLMVWTRPEAVLESFHEVLTGLPVEVERLHEEVDHFCQQIAGASQRAKAVFVPTWIVPTFHPGHGLLDLTPQVGVSRALMQANLRLMQNLDQVPNAFVLHAAKWVELSGEKAFNPRLWYTGKIPFGNELFKAAARDMKAALRGLGGGAKKLLVLDLDDLLWGGLVGEVGWQEIILGGHHPVGEALVDFQRELKALTRRGVILAIASKNEETVALEAIAKHPEMVLRRDDFAAWRINWKDKAQNIIELATELNLGLQSVVFLDDSHAERDRVRQALPEVLVPEWPADQRLYPHALRGLDAFEQPNLTKEDRQRAEMYVRERKRTELKTQAASMDEWLQTLGLCVRVEPLGPANASRAAQLLNKTNQMNLSTRRMTDAAIVEWAALRGHGVWVLYVTDRFGEAGLVGVLSTKTEGGRTQIVDFVLSCRVMGRKVEETLLHVAVVQARAAGALEVWAKYAPTEKNMPCLSFFQKSGWSVHKENTFTWSTTQVYPLHPAIRLEGIELISQMERSPNT